MKKALALLALTGTLAVAGTAGANSSASDASGYYYPPAMKKAFMKGCVAGDSEYVAYCGCAYNWMTAHVSFDRFMSASKADIGRWVKRADNACSVVWY